MRQQMRAERDCRATILTAEDVRQSQILTVEGDKQSAILRVEGQAWSAILKAQGESRVTLQVFNAIRRGSVDSKLLAYQYLQTLPKITDGFSSKIWVVPMGFAAALDGTTDALGGGEDGGPGGSDDSDDDAARSGVDLSGSELDPGIASDLINTSLQAPEEALTQARDEIESASQEANEEPAPGAGASPKAPTDEADGEATVSVPTSGDLEESHTMHGSHVPAPEETQPGPMSSHGGYGIQAQSGYGTPPDAPQGPYGA